MKYLITIFSIVILFSSCSDAFLLDPSGNLNARGHRDKYAGQFEEGSTILSEHYHQTLERTSDGKFIRKQFYPPNKQITHFETYSDRRMKVKDGIHKEWLDNGNLFKEGQFSNGKSVGEWKYYDLYNGHLGSVGNFIAGEKSGLWKNYRKEGTVYSEYNFQNGKKHGAYKLYNKEGQVKEEGTYKNGELDQKNILIKSEETEQFKIVETMPMFKNKECMAMANYEAQKKCAENKMLIFIYSNIRYPKLAREEGVEGQALVSFVIDRSGKVIDRKVHRGLCLDVSNEVSRIVDMMPDWNPGTQKGEPVKVHFNLPVKFKLH